MKNPTTKRKKEREKKLGTRIEIREFQERRKVLKENKSKLTKKRKRESNTHRKYESRCKDIKKANSRLIINSACRFVVHILIPKGQVLHV